MPTSIPICPDNAQVAPVQVHLEGGVPHSVELVEPGGASDKYIPPDDAQANRIITAVQKAGALGVCQKGGRLFAVLPSADDLPEELYGKKISISETKSRLYEVRTKPDFPVDPAQIDDKWDAFLNLTLGYLRGKTDLEEYLDEAAKAPPNYKTLVTGYLFDELQAETFLSKDHSDAAHADSITQVNRLMTELVYKLLNNDPAGWRQLAVAYMEAELHSGGLKAARWAVRLDPDDLDNWRVLAPLLLAYYQDDKEQRGHVLDEAERAFSKVVKLDYSDSGAMLNLGKVQMAKGDLKSAATSLEQAIEINLSLGTEHSPSNGQILSKLSLTYYRLRHFERALELADSANKLLGSNDIGVLMIMGLSLMAIDKPPEPEEPLPAQTNPRSIQIDLWTRIGKALYLSGRREEARNTFKIYLETNPKNIEAKVKLVNAMTDLYADQDEDEKDPNLLRDTFSLLNSIAEQRPDIRSPKLWKLRGNLALKLGDIEVAIFSYEVAAKSDPANNDHWRMLAHLLEKVGREKDELYALKRMMANGVEDDSLRTHIQERIKELEEFLNRRDPDDPEGSGAPPTMPGIPNASSPSEGGGQLMKSEWKGQSMADVGGFDPSEEDLFSTTFTESAVLLYNVTNTIDPNVGMQIMQGAGATTLGLPIWFTIPLAARAAGVPVH